MVSEMSRSELNKESIRPNLDDSNKKIVEEDSSLLSKKKFSMKFASV